MLSEATAQLVQAASAQQLALLARAISRALRQSQQRRIKAQRNPDGSAYEKRASHSKKKTHKPMFAKLASAKHLRASSSAAGVKVAFIARSARVAKAHHYGEQEVIDGILYTYPARELLGFSEDDIALIEQLAFQHLAGAG